MEAFPMDDFGMADRMAEYCDGRLRFITEQDQWQICSAGTWRNCRRAEAKELAREMLRALPALEGPRYSDERQKGQKYSPREAFLKWVARQQSQNKINSIVLLARDRPVIRVSASWLAEDH